MARPNGRSPRLALRHRPPVETAGEVRPGARRAVPGRTIFSRAVSYSEVGLPWARSLACAGILCLASGTAEAYPWMIRHDYTGCGVCHVDPSGAGLLTDYGRSQNVLLMQMHYGSPPQGDEAPRYAGFMFGAFPMPDWLLAQVTFRGAEFWVSQTAAGSPGNPSVTATDQRFLWMLLDARAELKLGAFRAAGAIGYGNTVYTLPALVVGSDTEQLIAREYWVGVSLVDNEMLIRLGRINVPFGLRNVEHTSWVRNNTQTDINYSQTTGLSVAFDNSRIRTEVQAILGNLSIHPDSFRERGLVGLLDVTVAERATVGISALVARAGESTTSATPVLRQVYGLFGRWSPAEPVALLLEGDVYLNDVLGSGNTQVNGVTWLQVDYEPIQGLHFMPALETLNAYGTGGTGFGTWLTIDWYCLPHTDIRLDGLYRATPGTYGTTNTFSFLVQLHVFL